MGSRDLSKIGIGVCLMLCATAAALAGQVNPRVSPRDQLKITVVNVPDWSRTYPVGVDGMLEFPQLGRLPVSGMTAREVEAEIGKRLISARVMLQPQVTVELEQTPNKKVSITGLVRVPGPLPYAGELTLLDAIGRAGGRLPEAADEVLVVRSGGVAAAEPMRVNAREIEGGNLEQNLTLQDGDQIFVLKAQGVFVGGEVRSPGQYPVEAGTTTYRQLVVLAGGVTERGKADRLQVKRMVDGEEKTVKVKPSDVAQPGDTLIVGRRWM